MSRHLFLYLCLALSLSGANCITHTLYEKVRETNSYTEKWENADRSLGFNRSGELVLEVVPPRRPALLGKHFCLSAERLKKIWKARGGLFDVKTYILERRELRSCGKPFLKKLWRLPNHSQFLLLKDAGIAVDTNILKKLYGDKSPHSDEMWLRVDKKSRPKEILPAATALFKGKSGDMFIQHGDRSYTRLKVAGDGLVSYVKKSLESVPGKSELIKIHFYDLRKSFTILVHDKYHSEKSNSLRFSKEITFFSRKFLPSKYHFVLNGKVNIVHIFVNRPAPVTRYGIPPLIKLILASPLFLATISLDILTSPIQLFYLLVVIPANIH